MFSKIYSRLLQKLSVDCFEKVNGRNEITLIYLKCYGTFELKNIYYDCDLIINTFRLSHICSCRHLDFLYTASDFTLWVISDFIE